MDEATAAQAQAKLEKLRRDLDAFMSSAATNSTGATVGTVSSVITEGGFKV
jgi:hypothetical protein